MIAHGNIKEAENYLLSTSEMKTLFGFRKSLDSGGKAGKGLNVSTSFMLFSEKLAAGMYFSYLINDLESFESAVIRAEKWKRRILTKRGRCPVCAYQGCMDSLHKVDLKMTIGFRLSVPR